MEKLIPCNNVSINIYCKSDDVDVSARFSKKRRSIKAENYTFTRTESLASRFNKFIGFLNVLAEKIKSSKVWTCEEYADITSRLILKRFNSDEIKSIKEDVASYDKFKENIVKEAIFKICPDDDLPASYKNGIAKGIDIAFGRS